MTQMTPRLRFAWLTIGWLLVVLVVYLSLKPGWLPLDALGRNATVHDLGYGISHVLAYGTLMLWFLQLYPISRRPWIALALLVLAAMLEVLQGLTPDREPSIVDMVANTVGIGLGWLFGQTRLSRTFETIEIGILRLKA